MNHQITTNDDYNKILKKYFGHEKLKDEQFLIINNIVNNKKDVCAILSTGYGKSICYQLPYLITDKTVIIVSPLISLMTDQKLSLEKLGIPVFCFNSDSKMTEKIKQMTSITSGMHKIVYVTPEYLQMCESFLKELNDMDGISMICIDEAHCMSSWGNDFRESYSKLNVIREWIPDVPILAVTATASEKVRLDICKMLKLKNPIMVVGKFDRPNLYINVSYKSDNIQSDLGELLTKYNNEYIIVYCKTRDDTDNVASKINDYGTSCYAYHAGLSNIERDNIQRKFNKGEYKCIVATIAFGMGINVPNVRLVIHYSCPKNLESYYQEIGRAGRDGLQSECYLFYSKKDFIINRFFIKDIPNLKHREYLEQEIRNIEKYVYTNHCRRKILLGSFGEDFDKCTNCDNCLNKTINTKLDFTEPAKLMLTVIKSLNGKFGNGTYINILRGSNSKMMEQHKNLIYYGSGKQYSAQYWKSLAQILTNEEYIKNKQLQGQFGATTECTKKAKDWLATISKYKNYEDIGDIDNIDKLMLDVPENMKLDFNVKQIMIKVKPKNTKYIPEKKGVYKDEKDEKDDVSGLIYDLYNEGKTLNDIRQIFNLPLAHIIEIITKKEDSEEKEFRLT